jgi:hypothetical protein
LPLGVPVLHTSDGSLWSGAEVPVQEKPIEAPVQPVTLESALHVDGTDVVSTQQ